MISSGLIRASLKVIVRNVTGETTSPPPPPPPVVFTDDFDRSNENLEASADWTRIDGTTGAAAVSSNRVSMSANETAYRVASGTLNEVDAYVEADIITQTIAYGFPVALRIADVNNFVGARYADTGADAWEIYKRVAGTFTLLGSFETSRSSTDRARLEANGDNVRLLVNDVEVIANQSLGGDLSANMGAGLVCRGSPVLLDNFEAGALS